MEIHEQIGEAVEQAEKKSKLNTVVATAVAVTATFMAVCNVKGGNVVQAMAKIQVDLVDTWSYFQAKSTKQSLAESTLEQLQFNDPSTLTATQKQAVDAYTLKVARYDKEKNELK